MADNSERMKVVSSLDLPHALVQMVQFNHPEPTRFHFQREGIFWIDLCLTPRRPEERGRYERHWVEHRFTKLGPIIAMPPGEPIELWSAGGRRMSIICQIDADSIMQWLPDDFEMTDRRLEACLDIASPEIAGHLRQLAAELRYKETGWQRMVPTFVEQTCIDIARYLISVTDADKRGSLAAWRLRAIDRRIGQGGSPPTLPELAGLCNMSVRQLTRAFRLTRGCTIGEYITNERTEAAKRRLATRESIKGIADSLGFSSHASFSNAFRRATGLTPNEFRTRVLRVGENG